MDELSQSDRTARPESKRWTSAGQLFTPFRRNLTPAPSVRNISMNSDEIENPIPPPIGSPHISYKLKDIEQALNNSPAPKMERPAKQTKPTTSLVSCYVTRSQTQHGELTDHSQITSFVIRGNGNSYKDPEYYSTIISRARRNILQTASLRMI